MPLRRQRRRDVDNVSRGFRERAARVAEIVDSYRDSNLSRDTIRRRIREDIRNDPSIRGIDPAILMLLLKLAMLLFEKWFDD